MLLYHGTTDKYLNSILTSGLKPRIETLTSNWAHTTESNRESVYLTKYYAGYFAHCAGEKITDGWIILEIDSSKLQELSFLPDEDYLIQLYHHQFPQKEIRNEITTHFRDNLEDYKEEWKNSLEMLGNCCYKGAIPTSAIKRIARWRNPFRNSTKTLSTLFTDPTISILNHLFCSGKYEALNSILFKEEVDLYSVVSHCKELDLSPELIQLYEPLVLQCQKELKELEIDIIEVNPN